MRLTDLDPQFLKITEGEEGTWKHCRTNAPLNGWLQFFRGGGPRGGPRGGPGGGRSRTRCVQLRLSGKQTCKVSDLFVSA
jgi:hypothetical protein